MNMKIIKYIPTVALLMAVAASCVKEPQYAPVSELSSITVNEICPVLAEGGDGWVEIANCSASSISICGLKMLVTDDYYYRYKVYEAPESATLSAGEKLVIVPESLPLKLSKLEEIVFASGRDSIIVELDIKTMIKELGAPAQDGSWSRIPDISGNFTVSEKATRGEKNYKFVPYKVDGLILNEICPSEGWVEIINNSFGALKLDETAIVLTDFSDYDHEIYKFGENSSINRDERIAVPVTIMDMKQIKLVSNEGKVVDTFSVSDVRDAGSIAAGNSY